MYNVYSWLGEKLQLQQKNYEVSRPKGKYEVLNEISPHIKHI